MATKPKVGQIAQKQARWVDADPADFEWAGIADAPVARSTAEPAAPEQDGPMARGVKQVSASVGLAGRLAARDFDGAAKNISDQAAYRAANPGSEEAQGLRRAWQQGDGIWGGIKGVAGEFADDYKRADGVGAGVMSVGRNLQAMGSSLVEQVPNMALPMAGMIGGGAAGSAAAGPIGTVAGGWAGASAGNALVGTSEAAFRQLEKAGVNPTDAAAVREYLANNGDAILGETAIKGGVIGAVDVATAGLAHWLLSGPGKMATTKALTEMGVDMADKAAVKAATKTPVFKNLIANDATYQATQVGAQKLLRNTGAAATEPVGEFAGEYGGSLAATGEADAKDAFLEAASSLGQSGIMFAGQKAIQAIKSPSQAAADQIRATEKLPESGALTRAVNTGVEAKAQAIEAGAPLVDEQAIAEPEPVDDPVRDQILALPDGARQDALRAYAVVNRTDVAKGVQQYNRKLLDRLLAENAPPPVLGERLTDTDMGAMLGGGGMAGRADPLAGALGMNNDAQAAAITNVANVAERRPPMPASDAARMLDEARSRGLDLAVAEHPAGGFVLVPPNWVTPDMAAQGEARLNETIARMQQADAAPVDRAPRNRISPVELNLPTDPVQNYVGNLRTVNTPAARAYVRDFDAGRITPADVQQRMQAEKGLTPEQRIARAAAEAPAQADPVADRLARAAAQGMATPAPTDILNPAGEPFKTRMAADRAAKKTPGAVVPVEGGFVVRPQEPVNVQDVPQAPEVPQAAPAISQPGQAPQAMGAQPAGPAAGVPAEGVGAVEAAGVIPEGGRNEPQTQTNKAPEATESVAQAPAQPLSAPVGDEQPFAPESGTLGIPRAEMPQVPTQSHGGLVKHLNAQGIDHETTMVDAAGLKPTQAEFSPSKVEKAKEATGDRAVIVSSDGHIIDGHHQALAAAEEGKPVKAIVLDAPVEQALEAVKNSPSAQPQVAADVPVAKPINRSDVDAARQQAATAIGERIDAMTAQEVQKIAARFLPTMGVRVPAGKARIKEAVTSAGPRMNWAAAAAEFGAELPQDAMSALQADVEGRVQEGPVEALTTPAGVNAGAALTASPVRIGRDQTPLSEGGKPFKTRKAAGDAKKLQPMMRVVTVPGGYALAEKTPAQLAAEERASRRLRNPNTSARGEPIPAHAFIAAAGGLNRVAASDMGVDGNPRIGNRRLFSGQGRGLSMDQATQMLIQDGYLSEGATINDALALIKKSLTQPQYNADGIERIAQAEADAQFEDYLAAQEDAAADDDEFDPFGPAPTALDEFSDDMLESSGYDAATDAIKAEVRALLEMANAQGIDTESIMLEAHEQTRNATEQDYYEAAKSALEAAIAGSNRDRGTPAGGEGQGPGAAATSAAEQGLNQPVALNQQAQAATENVAPAALELAAQTPAEAAARQEEAEQAEKSQAAAKRAADAAAKAEDDRKRIAQASVRAADRFELGQDPMDSLTGQGGLMFSRTGAKSPNAQQPTTRAWYDRFVSLLPASYRNDPHRREPLPAEDWNVQRASEVRSKVEALNKQLRGANDRKGYGPVSVDGLGNLQVDARSVSAADLSGPIRALADELGAGVAATNVRSSDVRALLGEGFVSETSLAAIADRLMGRPFAQPVNTYTKDSAPGTILTYKPRGFPAALFSRSATPHADSMFNGKEMANAPMPANAAQDAATTAQPLRTPAATIRAAITKAYGKLLDQLESKGLVTLTQTEDEAIEAAAQARAAKTGGDVEAIKRSMINAMQGETDLDVKRSSNGAIQGFFDPQTGQSFLIADNLTAEAAPGVLMHEVGIHMAADGSMKALFNRAAMMLKLQRGNPFMKAVQDRMDAAGETSGEEAAAYIAEAYENDRANAPASVQRWLADLLAAVKAWMFKKGIMGADRLTVADIAAVARANAKTLARGQQGVVVKRAVAAFSRDTNGAVTNQNDVVGKTPIERPADDSTPGAMFDAQAAFEKHGGTGDIDESTDITAKSQAFADMAEAEGYTVIGRGDKYVTIKKSFGQDADGYAKTAIIKVRISDHSNVNRGNHFGETDINIAPDDGYSRDTFGDALRKIQSAYVNDDLDTVIPSEPTASGLSDPANPDIRFSRTTDAAKAVGDTLKSITVANVKQRAGFKLTDYLGIGLQALGRRQIVDIYGDLVPLAEYNRLVQQMEADKNEGGAEADQLVTRWAKLEDEGKLADLMHDATLAQIDPAEDLVDGDDKGKYLELRRKYNLLSDDAKKVYADTRDSYKAHHAKVRKAIKERIERSEIKGERKAALLKQMDDEFFKAVKGVYFPLARFGQYAVTVKGPDGKVESVSRAETKAEAEALRNNLLSAFPRDKGFTVGRVMLSKDFIADRDAVGRGFMTELYQVLDKQDMDAAQRAELEDTLGQLYLSSLPDLSWAKHGIHRKGTPGFSQDARRAFAQNMFHGARYLAKLRYSDLMQDELAAMQRHVDDWREVEDFDQNSAQRVVTEMYHRHESLMNPKSNKLSTWATSLGFVFHLGLSPASAMVNLSQTALVAYPIMGAKWGFGKASAALLKASAEAAKGKNDITGSLNADERAAYDEAVRAGTIDVTMAHDLAGIAQGEDAGVMWKIRPVMRWASFLFHHAERFNRQVTFVAAYRLAREAGADHKAAFEQATKATYDGHYDYSAANRPRIMQGNVAKVLLLFKQYGQNMVYTLARNAQQAIKGESPEVRAQASKALGGLLATHAAAAGVLGLPMVTTLLAAASMIGGDDDEPWDAKVALQNMLADTFGQKPAEVLAHGLSRLTPWDISGRVGLDKLIFPDVQEGLEGQRLWESAATQALGPVGGIFGGALKGLDLISDGHYKLGLEAMLPAVLRQGVKSIRYATDGVQDKTGVVIKDDVSLAGVAGQLLGFSPSEVRLAQEGKSAIYQHDKALTGRRQELLSKAARATRLKDTEARAEAMKEIERFNQKNPPLRITPLNVLQSVRNSQKRIDQAEGGVYLPKNRRDAMEAGRFAVVD